MHNLVRYFRIYAGQDQLDEFVINVICSSFTYLTWPSIEKKKKLETPLFLNLFNAILTYSTLDEKIVLDHSCRKP